MQKSIEGLTDLPNFAEIRKKHQRRFMDYVGYPKDLRMLYLRFDPDGENAVFMETHVVSEDQVPKDGSPPEIGPNKVLIKPWDSANPFYLRYAHITEDSKLK